MTKSSGTRAGPPDREPRSKRRRGRFPQGEASLAAALTEDQHAGLRLKGQIVDPKRDQFGDAQRSGVAQVQHRAVTNATPDGRIGRVQDGLHFIGRQMPDETRFGLLGGDRQDLPNPVEGGGDAVFQEVHERLDGGQTSIAGARSVAARRFQVVQEVDDQRRASICSKANWEGGTLSRLLT